MIILRKPFDAVFAQHSLVLLPFCAIFPLSQHEQQKQQQQHVSISKDSFVAIVVSKEAHF
jgi:hypothetical protein